MMTKTEKLRQLDTLVLDKMISLIETGETNLLPELGNAIQYLKANSVVEIQKQEDDALAQRKKKLEEAKKRREQQV
jgi:hypothetical protein